MGGAEAGSVRAVGVALGSLGGGSEGGGGRSRVCTTHGVLPSCTWEREAVFIPTNKTGACKKSGEEEKAEKNNDHAK